MLDVGWVFLFLSSFLEAGPAVLSTVLIRSERNALALSVVCSKISRLFSDLLSERQISRAGCVMLAV